MPLSIAIGDVIAMRYEGRLQDVGSRLFFGRFWRLTALTSTLTSDVVWLEEFGNFMGARFNTSVLAQLSDSYNFEFSRIQRIAPTLTPPAISAGGAGSGGTAGGPPEPNSAIVVSFRSDHTGRSGMNRIFLPPPAAADATNGLLEAGFVTTLAENVNECWEAEIDLTNDCAATVIPICWSPSLYESTEDVDDSAFPVVQALIDSILRRQQRRDWRGQNYSPAAPP